MKVLIIDDNKNLVLLIKKFLEEKSYVVDTAYTGERAIDLSKTNDYDVILMDYMLPDKDAPDICYLLRENNVSCPIIITSGLNLTENKIKILNLGADDYLTKPFSFEELWARINALLRRPKNFISQKITIDNLSINLLNRKVTFLNKEIILTNKEFALLEYFVRNQGIILSKNLLLEHVWDMNIDPFTNTLEAHIFSLRKKLKTVGFNCIKTISGAGYILENNKTI